MFIDQTILNNLQAENIQRESALNFSMIDERPIHLNNQIEITSSFKDNFDSRATWNKFDRMFIDNIGASHYILEQLARKNNWVKWALHVASHASASTIPLFQITNIKGNNINKIKEINKKLRFPNLNETGYELFYKTFHSLKQYGNAYWQVIKTRDGKNIHSIYYIPSSSIRPVPFINKQNGQLEFAYVQLNSYYNKIDRVYFQDEIIHFKVPNPDNIVYGVSSLVPLFKDIMFDEEGKNWIVSWFQKSFNAGMIFKMPNSSKDVVKRNRDEMREKFSGTENAGRTMVVEGDMALLYDGNKARDINLSELKEISRDDILTCMGVPLSVAGVRTKSGSGNAEIVASEDLAMLRNTVSFLHQIVFETLNLRLFGYILKNNDMEIKSGVNQYFSLKNAESLVTTASKFAGTTINENRKMVGLAEIVEGENLDFYNTPLVSTNNGILPLPDLFKQFSQQDSQVADTKIEQPSLNVSAEKAQAKVD